MAPYRNPGGSGTNITKMREKYDRLPRVKPTPALRAEVLAFYEERCLLHSVEVRPGLVIDLHHIDECSSHTRFENLVPVCKSCNGAFQVDRYKSKPALSGFLHPDAITVRAREFFSIADYSGSHGCYRLAAHLFATRFRNVPQQLYSLTASIGPLRALFEPRLLRYVIIQSQEIFKSLQPQELPIYRAAFLSQMGLLLYDFQEFKEAMEFQSQAYQLRRKINKKLVDSELVSQPEDEAQEMANYARRLAFVVQDSTKAPKHIRDEALASLDEGISLFERHGNFRGFATNLDVKAYLEIRRFGYATARTQEFAERALEVELKINNQWVRANHHITLGDFYYSQFKKTPWKRLKDRAVEELRQGCDILTKHQICLEPSPTGGLFRPDIKLIDLGVTDAQRVPERGKFPFSKKELNGILSTVLSR
jgi:hypothetical protein